MTLFYCSVCAQNWPAVLRRGSIKFFGSLIYGLYKNFSIPWISGIKLPQIVFGQVNFDPVVFPEKRFRIEKGSEIGGSVVMRCLLAPNLHVFDTSLKRFWNFTPNIMLILQKLPPQLFSHAQIGLKISMPPQCGPLIQDLRWYGCFGH